MTMSINEIFYKVEKHLLKQNEQAIGSSTVCKYRTDSGLSCAVGCLIPDEIYSSKIEGGDITDLPANILTPLIGLQYTEGWSEKLHLLEKLQAMHDNRLPEKWPTYLADIKTEFNIN